MKKRHLSTLLRWAVLGASFIFLLYTLSEHWQNVSKLRFSPQSWWFAAASLGTALTAHVWSAYVWSWILEELQQSVSWQWAIAVFLKNSPSKYLPGNIWHLYGRVRDAQQQGIAVEVAALSVVLEPLLIAIAALGLALGSTPNPLLQGLSLLVTLLCIHPKFLNRLLKRMSRDRAPDVKPIGLRCYPFRTLLGELVFVGLRGLSFLLCILAFTAVDWSTIGPLISRFSFAWLLGLIVPGAPGGLGVFEATALGVLKPFLAPSVLLGTLALYRLVSTLAELLGASFVVATGFGQLAQSRK